MPTSWRPPFCPHPDCPNAHPQTPRWVRCIGTFTTLHGGAIHRFRCNHCQRTMSESTFNIQYRTKIRLDLPRLIDPVHAGEGIRAIGRSLGIRAETVTNRLNRLARQAIAVHALARSHMTIGENLTADGLVSFTWSQYFPVNYHVLVGSDSQYCHVVDYAVTRRSGTMSKAQKRRNTAIREQCTFPKQSIDRSFQRVYSLACALSDTTNTGCIFDTDEHYQYPRSMAQVDAGRAREGKPRCLVHRTTSSKAIRNTSNPLMAVNYFDREIRKDCANHTRETLQWSHEANNAMLRMNLYLCHHNFLKPWRIKNRKEKRSHGEVAGLAPEFCRKVQGMLLGERVFLSRVEDQLCESERITWRMKWPNPHNGKSPKIWRFIVA